ASIIAEEVTQRTFIPSGKGSDCGKILTFRHVPSVDNPADILTKILPKATWWHLMKQILHHPAM
ncbi:MAG: hypothetical protein ACREOZ_03395, partial [Gloeomargaritales cyanobacterium]